MSDEVWRVLVNSYEDLPEDGAGPPDIEIIQSFAPDPDESKEVPEGQLFVQKVVTEMYIFTDSENQAFGEHTFQDMVILGLMTKEKLTKLLNRQKRKREKGS